MRRYGGEQQDLVALNHDPRMLLFQQRGSDVVFFEQALERTDHGADDPTVSGIERVEQHGRLPQHELYQACFAAKRVRAAALALKVLLA